MRFSRRIAINGIALCFLFILFYFFSIPARPYLTVVGNVRMSDGIGRQSVELVRGMHQDVEVGFFPTRVGDLTDVPQEILPIFEKPNKRLGRVILYESSLPNPDHKMVRRLERYFHGPKRRDQIRIAYVLAESSVLPEEHVQLLSSHFDAVAVPDQFLKDVLERSGVTIPIFLLPLSLDLKEYLSQPLKATTHTPFCFINLSSMIDRKNHEGLIRAFHKAFGDDPTVQLLMNYRYYKGDALARVKALLKQLETTNIILQDEALNASDYLEFFLKGDVFVTLSKGEGFSIQPREAMALGLPVILSDNSAHRTILASGLAHGVSCPETVPYYDAFRKCYCGEVWEADVEEAAIQMRHIRDHYDQILADSAARREWVERYLFVHLRGQYLALIKPEKVTLGESNMLREGELTTTSPELFEKYCELLSKKSS